MSCIVVYKFDIEFKKSKNGLRVNDPFSLIEKPKSWLKRETLIKKYKLNG